MSKLLRGVALFDEHLDEVLEMLVFNWLGGDILHVAHEKLSERTVCQTVRFDSTCMPLPSNKQPIHSSFLRIQKGD